MRFFYLITLTATLFLSGLAQATPQNFNQMPHFDLEMTGKEYALALEHYKKITGSDLEILGALDPVFALGKRNMDWLRFINEGRNPEISFSSAATQSGYPMDQPNAYNESIVLQKYRTLIASLPPAMKKVLIDGADFTKEPPLALADYIKWGLQTDRVYQSAARWVMMQPYLYQLEMRRANDVRGVYFLSQDPERETNFKNFEAMPTEKQTQYREWLIQMCLNNGGSSGSCTTAVDRSRADRSLESLYARYKPKSDRLWNGYFTLGGKNSSVQWNQPNTMIVPFVNPGDADRRSFIKLNLEDEWRFGSWKLSVPFAGTGIEVIWEAGIVPHVPGLGADSIYMDANQPLTEYDAQWTIRHEFGHVLGLPDCYVEFYDSGKGIITNYQLDITNLMCSRRGHIQDKHVQELRRVYYQGK